MERLHFDTYRKSSDVELLMSMVHKLHSYRLDHYPSRREPCGGNQSQTSARHCDWSTSQGHIDLANGVKRFRASTFILGFTVYSLTVKMEINFICTWNWHVYQQDIQPKPTLAGIVPSTELGLK